MFAKEIHAVIKKKITEEYAAFPYACEQIPHIPKCDIQFVISDQLFLDVLLMKMRSKTIPTMKKLQTEEKEKEKKKKKKNPHKKTP